MPLTDPGLEQLYVYVKALRTLLRDPASGGLDLGGDLVLTHLRPISHDPGDIELEPGEIEPGTALPGGGHGGGSEPKLDSLAEIIAAINERFGTDLDERDRLEVEKVELSGQQATATVVRPGASYSSQAGSSRPRHRQLQRLLAVARSLAGTTGLPPESSKEVASTLGVPGGASTTSSSPRSATSTGFNQRRLHGEIAEHGYVTPAEFEAAYYRQSVSATQAGTL